MRQNLIFISVFFNSIFFSFSIVQNWNFDNAAIDLLSESSSFSIEVLEETTLNLYVKFYKYFANENGAVVYRKYLTMIYDGAQIFEGEVDYDGIESYHHFENDNIICPKGKYHPIYYYDGTFSSFNPPSFVDNGDWELKCIINENGYFMIFYLMNGNSNFYYKKAWESDWSKMELHQEIYGVKLSSTGNDNDEYPFAYIANVGGMIRLLGEKYLLKMKVYIKMMRVE